MSTAEDRGTRSRHGSAATAERRALGNGRMPFEAIVEVGAHSVGGFEAESVNLSPEGIRLRTAYLPELGDTLVCRFDGFGGEVMAEGQVIWRKPEARGGEFGVQFTRLDDYAAQVLESMCVSEEELEESEAPPSAQPALPGTRVRVHIQGLGSPMRARVRDAAGGEVLIGSNLEFLRVGRDVELEDVEQGDSKTAQIEHVDVAIDPETHIPQLIVTLRCEGEQFEMAPDSSELVTAPLAVPVGRHVAGAPTGQEQEITPGPTVVDRDGAEPAADAACDDEPYTPAMAGEGEYTPYGPAEQGEYDYTPYSARGDEASGAPAPISSRSAEEAEGAGEGEPAAAPAKAAAARLEGAKRRASALAGKVAPALSAAGSGAKGALGKILARVREKRAESKVRRLTKQRDNKPLRKTAPPPSGALRSDGKRLFRESHPAPPPSEAEPAPRTDRKRAVFGVVLGILAVVAIYLASSKVNAWMQDAPPVSATKPAEEAAVDEAAAADQAAPPAPGGAIATANVPLFGATPLSTTEPVPVPPDPNAVDSSDDEGEEEGADAAGAAKPAMALEKEWGVGTIHDPSVLKLKMDGPIEGLSGSEGATGFTLVIPGRKSISSAAGLIRKDKRLESVNVVNYPDRAEVTVLFKKDVPAFRAKASGKRLIIEIGSEESKSKKSSKKKRSHSTGSKKKRR